MAVWQVLLEDAAHEDHRGVCEKREDFIAAALDISDTGDVENALQGLEYVGLISVGIGAVTINNWAKWQYDQDVIDPTNSSRQKRFRERKREQHESVTPRNGDVTVRNCPDTDTDTDTERKKDISVDFRKTAKTRPMQNAAFEKFWNAYPKRDGANPRMPAFKKFDAKVRAGADPAEIEAGAVAYARAMSGKDPQFVAQAVTWLNQERWKDHTGPPVQPTVYTLPPLKILTDAELEAQMLAREAEEDARNQRDELLARGADMRKVSTA
jgi:hypothetical protein